MYCYQAYGLQVRSVIECPELWAGDPALPADLTVELGPVPEALDNPGKVGVTYQATRNEFLLTARGVARYWVRHGTHVTVQRQDGSDDDSVRLFLLGLVFSAALNQRGDAPLHASAIVVERDGLPAGAVLFAGDSGRGKSTLAAAFRQCGFVSLSDDISVLRRQADGKVFVYPAFAQIKLWQESVQMLDLPDDLPAIRPNLRKYAMRFAGDSQMSPPLPVIAVYGLDVGKGAGVRLQPIEGFDKVKKLQDNIFGRQYAQVMGQHGRQFAALLALAQQARVCAVERPEGVPSVVELMRAVQADWEQS